MNGTYPHTLAACILRVFQRALMGVGDNGGGVHGMNFGVGGDGVDIRNRARSKGPTMLVKVRLPVDNHLFVVLRTKPSRNYIPFAPLRQFHLNFFHGTVIENILVGGSKSMSLFQLTTSVHSSHRTWND